MDPGSSAALGTSLGFVHVLTGPDHLSAIATLSCGKRLRSLFLGIRWGVGHSLGIALVYVVFLLIPDFELENLGDWGDMIVGVLMILLGLFGLYRAQQFRKLKQGCQSHALTEDASTHLTSDISADITTLQQQSQQAVSDHSPAQADQLGCPESNEMRLDVPILVPDHTIQQNADASGVMDADQSASASITNKGCLALLSRIPDAVLALLMGIFHGFAGAGGVLAIIPALSMRHEPATAAAYLGCFFGASIFAMAIFAAAFGELSARVGGSSTTVQFCMMVSASLLSVLFGVLWEILIATGTMETVFH